MKRTLWIWAMAVGLGWGCSHTVPNRSPVGEPFPTVRGTALTGEAMEFPLAVKGTPAVLLIGYEQRTQFDLDRWILGLLQLETPVELFEIPTIEGWVPGLISERIDQGMRSGIPASDWAAVVTVYEDADRIVAFTGNERPANGRIALLDKDGTVVFFWDEGYSGKAAMSLDSWVRKLKSGENSVPPSEKASPE